MELGLNLPAILCLAVDLWSASPTPCCPTPTQSPVSHPPLVPKAHSSPGKSWAPQTRPALPILPMGCACGGLPIKSFHSPIYFSVCIDSSKVVQALKVRKVQKMHYFEETWKICQPQNLVSTARHDGSRLGCLVIGFLCNLFSLLLSLIMLLSSW